MAPIAGSQITNITVFVRAGSVYENNNERGMSHFLEHMLLKGTHKHKNTAAVVGALDAAGAVYNAYTEKDHTAFYATVQYKKADAALAILAEMLEDSTLKKVDIEKEKRVVVDELISVKNSNAASIISFYEHQLFHGAALAKDLGGTEHDIYSFTQHQVVAFFKKYYCAQNTIVILSGKLSPKLIAQAKRLFVKQAQGVPPVRLPIANINANDERVGLLYRNTASCDVMVGAGAYPATHKYFFPLMLASFILGESGMSSRLFTAVRDKKGLVYDISSVYTHFEHGGYLAVKTLTDINNVKEVLGLIMRELVLMRKNGLSAVELRHAKSGLIGRTVLQFNDVSVISTWYGKQAIRGQKILTPESAYKKLSLTTRRDIKMALSDVLDKGKVGLVIAGPFNNHAEFAYFLI